MASPLTTSCRRFLPSTSCSRAISSAARHSPKFPGSSKKRPPTESENIGKARGSELTQFLDGVVQEYPNGASTLDGTQNARRLGIGRDDCLIRSIDFNREFNAHRPPYANNRRRGSLGPGREARYGNEDIFLQLGIDPRREADNEALLSAYVTDLGRIKPRNQTKLTQRSQRLVGKAIKRAKMMGAIPFFSNPKIHQLSPAPKRASRTPPPADDISLE